MASKEIKDRLAMDNAYEKAEFHARIPNSSENRRLVYAAYHGCIVRGKRRFEEGERLLATEWSEMAHTISLVCGKLNARLHFDRQPPSYGPDVPDFVPGPRSPMLSTGEHYAVDEEEED
jgi:hypothetical protein